MINFIKKRYILGKKIFFSKEDILSLWVSEEVLNILLEEKQIRHLIDDIYTLPEEEVSLVGLARFILADKLNKWSYITWLTALDHHNLLYWSYNSNYFTWHKKEEIQLDNLNVEIVISATETPDIVAEDYYIPFNLSEIEIEKHTVCFATPEQALVDKFFNNNYIEDENAFEWEWRLVRFLLKDTIDKEKLLKMAIETNDEKTIKSTNNFINWITN